MEKLLVLGADRVVGAHLVELAAERFEVVAPSRADCDAPAELVLSHAPDWTVYCGAFSASTWDQVQPAELSGEVARAATVAQAVAKTGGRLTVISTDALFDAPRLYHAEDSPTAGGHPLAETALAVEAAVEAAGAIVIRTHAFGLAPVGASAGFAQRVAEALMNGEAVQADGRRYASPIYAGDLAELLLACHEGGLRGVYHVAGAERVSQRRFAGELAASLGVDWSLDESPRVLDRAAPSRLETSLICLRAQRALSQPMPWLRDGLQAFAEECHDLLRAADHSRAQLRGVAA